MPAVLGDAARYDLDAAALQTFVAPSADPKLATDVGRTFVALTGAVSAADRLTDHPVVQQRPAPGTCRSRPS